MKRAWSASVENALHAWVVKGSGLAAERVIWAQQRGPRPSLPCIIMRCAVLAQPGIDWLDTEDAELPAPGQEVAQLVRGLRIASLELQCFADATDDSGLAAQAILSDVIAAGMLPSVRHDLCVAGVGLSIAEPIQFLGGVTDFSVFEPRAITRVSMHLANEISESGTFIEFVETINCIKGVMPASPPPVYTQRVIYVRTTGDDNSTSGDINNPLRTFYEALRRLPERLEYERWIIDIDGITEEPNVNIEMLTPRSPGTKLITEPAPTEHRTFFQFPPVTVRANPVVAHTIASANLSVIAEPTHGMLLVTDTSASWTPDEHKGRFLLGGTFGNNPMPIMSNTSNTLTVAGSDTLTDPIEILDVGATLKYGRGALPVGQFFFLNGFTVAANCGLIFQWVAFERPSGNTSPMVRTRNDGVSGLSFYGCRVVGGMFAGGGGILDFDGCYFDGGFFTLDGLHDQAVNIRNCGFQGVSFTGHDSNYFAKCCRVFGSGSFGTQITSQYVGNIDIQNCDIQSSSGDGIALQGSNQHRIRDTVVANAGGNGVNMDGPQSLQLVNVQGTGNAGHGLKVRNGAQVEVSGGTGITGTGGDIDAGGALGTQLWSAVPFIENSAATDVRVHLP